MPDILKPVCTMIEKAVVYMVNDLSDMGLLNHPVLDDLVECVVVFVQSLNI